MALDPRTPVVVGVGQVTNRPTDGVPPERRIHPFALMAAALRAAAADCTTSGGAGELLLARAGSLAIVGGLGWRAINPGQLVAEELGIAPRELVRSATGGNMPMSLIHRAAGMIGRGEVDVALIAGGECLYTKRAARTTRTKLAWPEREPGGIDGPGTIGFDRPPATDLEVAHGVVLPIYAYPLLENAFRAARGWSIDEHRARIGRLWARLSDTAAANPHAWIHRSYTPGQVMTPTADNRRIALPYTKLCTANLNVDQAAAIICCSADAASAAGVPRDRWVFPLGGAEASDHWFLSDRPGLASSPAIRIAGRRALALAGVGIDDIRRVDLYSCFPIAVEMAATELGLPLDDRDRSLTTTGGLTFAGGPGNNYATHGLASLVSLLRGDPGMAGLSTGLGWYATKHAIGVFASRPPEHAGAPFRWEDTQPSVDSLPRCTVDTDATGPVSVETYTVTYDRDGAPQRGIVAARTPTGHRTWASVDDPDGLSLMATDEVIGRVGHRRTDGVLDLN